MPLPERQVARRDDVLADTVPALGAATTPRLGVLMRLRVSECSQPLAQNEICQPHSSPASNKAEIVTYEYYHKQ